MSFLQFLRRLDDFRGWRRRQLCAKHSIPEAAGDAEAILVVHEVVLEVVLLQFLVEGRQPVACQYGGLEG